MSSAKKIAVPALGLLIGALGVYLVRTLPEGFLFPILCLSAAVTGLFVVLPAMVLRRQKRIRSGGAVDYDPPVGLSVEEERRFRHQRARRDIRTIYALLAVLCLVTWWVSKLRH